MSDKSAIQISLLGCFTIGFAVAVGYVCGQEAAREFFKNWQYYTEPGLDNNARAQEVNAGAAKQLTGVALDEDEPHYDGALDGSKPAVDGAWGGAESPTDDQENQKHCSQH